MLWIKACVRWFRRTSDPDKHNDGGHVPAESSHNPPSRPQVVHLLRPNVGNFRLRLKSNRREPDDSEHSGAMLDDGRHNHSLKLNVDNRMNFFGYFSALCCFMSIQCARRVSLDFSCDGNNWSIFRHYKTGYMWEFGLTMFGSSNSRAKIYTPSCKANYSQIRKICICCYIKQILMDMPI